MLWYKGWLEIRFRLLFVLAAILFFICMQHPMRGSAVAARAAGAGLMITTSFASSITVLACAALAGVGIATQPPIGMTKGLHGSTLFTVSLPVKRSRLMATRATIGWLCAMTMIVLFCVGIWYASPALQLMTTMSTMGAYIVTMICCGTAIYAVSLLFGTVLDDQWRTWGTMLFCYAYGWATSRISLPAFADLRSAMGTGSPLLAHGMPWNTIAFSLGLAAVFYFAALKVVQAREF